MLIDKIIAFFVNIRFPGMSCEPILWLLNLSLNLVLVDPTYCSPQSLQVMIKYTTLLELQSN